MSKSTPRTDAAIAKHRLIGKQVGFDADFYSDLNAMHEAEKSLTIDQQAEYWVCLHHLTDADECTGHWLDLKATGCATAAQRAEAFLKTLGLWEE